jgi:hypothetical protein
MPELATREDVIWAYREFLNRRPESEAMIQSWLAKRLSRAGLIDHFVHTDEFKSVVWNKAVAEARKTVTASVSSPGGFFRNLFVMRRQ